MPPKFLFLALAFTGTFICLISTYGLYRTSVGRLHHPWPDQQNHDRLAPEELAASEDHRGRAPHHALLSHDPYHWCNSDTFWLWPICSTIGKGKQPRFAYVQYATTPEYLCNSLIAFSRLRRFETRAELALLYPLEWESEDAPPTPRIVALLEKARALGVNFHPIHVLSRDGPDSTWSASFTKLIHADLVEYDRVLHLDSDGLIMQNMDHLFFSPDATIALPRAYWLNDAPSAIKELKKPDLLASHIMLLKPSTKLFERLRVMMEGEAVERVSGYDMELINRLAGGSALILPHRRYAMLSGEFRTEDHSRYLSDQPDSTKWDAGFEAAQAFYIHFSDWPLPKPWLPRSPDLMESIRPACNTHPNGCAERALWESLYAEYDNEMGTVCNA